MAEVLAKQPRPEGPAPDDRHQRRRPRRARHRRPHHRRRRTRPALRRDHRRPEQIPARRLEPCAIPIDILGDAGPDRYAKTLEIAAKDPNSDGLLVILTPQAMTDPTGPRSSLKPYASRRQAGPGELDGRRRRRRGRGDPERAGIPTFAYPDTAARAFIHVAVYSYNLRGALRDARACRPATRTARQRAGEDVLDAVRARRAGRC